MHYNLKKLTIDNFRVFNKPTTIEFSPLTIFTGANNGGKSSVNKALNLLAKSHEDNGLSSLSLIGNQLNLGSFKSLTNNKGKRDTISFCLEIQTAFVENADFKIEMSFKEWVYSN
ncbi:MAG: AAA family ATPase [Chitinophagaceae bacterium]|nr:AAA family ATPase [Chitinophagaceae bacterium]